jgi:hypothetical protein
MTKSKLSFNYSDYYGSGYFISFIYFIFGLSRLPKKGFTIKWRQKFSNKIKLNNIICPKNVIVKNAKT